MIRAAEIWDIMLDRMIEKKWTSLQEIYDLVARYGTLDDEDYAPDAPGSVNPKWKRNVRNVLQKKKSIGHIKWDGEANYQL